ncbi:hypothetical protein AB0I28_32825 [Phytomonospora sp. NPDC050363]|uniref:hypothetical protein n=1 Tax=Phytomonospora sp. NPDC050363 TaxID=3155642 RepID=UPI0033D02E3B
MNTALLDLFTPGSHVHIRTTPTDVLVSDGRLLLRLNPAERACASDVGHLDPDRYRLQVTARRLELVWHAVIGSAARWNLTEARCPAAGALRPLLPSGYRLLSATGGQRVPFLIRAANDARPIVGVLLPGARSRVPVTASA